MRAPCASSPARSAKFQAFSDRLRPFWRSQPQVFLLHHHRRPSTSASSAANSGSGIAAAERGQAEISATLRSLISANRSARRSPAAAGNPPASAAPAAYALKRSRNSSTRVGAMRQAGGVRVAAELHEQLRHRFQRFQQMKRVDAAAGALRQAVLASAQHEDGTMEALHQAAGHDAEHAAMPVLAAITSAAWRRPPGCATRTISRDLGFRLLPIGIQLVQLLRQLARAFRHRR